MKPYYDQGGFTIYHGDCLDILPKLEGVGAIVTDPPYSSGGQFRGDRMASTVSKYVRTDCASHRPEFSGDNRDQRSFLAWCMMWCNAARVASIVGAPIVCFSDWRQLPTITDAIQCGGWTWRNIGTWWKPGCRMQKGRFSSSAEYVVYGTSGPALPGISSPQNVFSWPSNSEKLHIAEKPLPVMKWCMGVVPAGSLVLDPFMGVGTTLRAAKDLGMSGIGIEIDEKYCEVAAEKLRQEVLF